ncbi:MAG: AmmeMemoRadiSam system protein A [Candidatus Aminicenantes bacterium]|nr:AmmeMemoRadiSam system protein A [Candidatus Aminicenantes bacterium]
MEEYLNPNQQTFLLDLARRAILDYLQSHKKSKPKIEDEDLKEKRGAFVTLKTEGELRGCIGYVLPHHPLYETIIDAAVASATQDFRFQPMTLEEMDSTKIEISVLTLPRPIKNVEDIKVGKHGIIISRGTNKGLLLPQVPLEWGWDRETYLKHGCLKAGLEDDAWKTGAQIEIFSAQVFSEP